MRNLLTKVPKSAQSLVATLVRTIFAQPDAELTHAQHARVVEQLQGRWPDAARLVTDTADDLLAFTALPKEHWRQIWSNNPQERLNRELRRRTDVVGSSRTAPPSCGSSARCSPSSTTSGRSCAAT
jgi:putative transposase